MLTLRIFLFLLCIGNCAFAFMPLPKFGVSKPCSSCKAEGNTFVFHTLPLEGNAYLKEEAFAAQDKPPHPKPFKHPRKLATTFQTSVAADFLYLRTGSQICVKRPSFLISYFFHCFP
jgi:hypothetical protein